MKVNILMSTYNGQQFLAEQIRSIQEQTYTDWTLFIRDDGSSDNTKEILKDFERQDSRVHLIDSDKSDNLGVIKSFHKLVNHDRADYYFFSDQDDVWLPNKLELSLNEAQNYPANLPLMVYMDLKVVNQDLEIMTESMVKSQSHHANTELVQELTENTVTGGVAMINHTLAEMWQETDGILMHDWYLALLASAFGNLVFIDQPGELYRQHSDNVLGARTLSKRFKKWIRPHILFAVYWDLIKNSQKQARHLLQMPLSQSNRELIEAFVTIMDKPMLERFRILRKYGLRKNKTFHTLVFTTLIVTKFAYKE
ncbi:glycosyltransferase family 2 protein [Streptococcus suis]|uniref:Polysaccharide biosynthesis protein/ rhamnosyl transferase n=1 Tax=Streptococcus suis TaxID=1307 RepID=A0A116Q407_STRSU|nr:glycosyltransferase family 2 protein [Streptococcus suis]NQN59253.1 glycosyltransferase family 2 protein [Streptococcus suis]NQP75219.1 glycosyltransferase family 2 protein [Streptococcus suis]NQP77325.1 glycosyltransferase family 2 protein [Streptococcus suis]NQP90826.1 glycosyltransferase family 2 protein [Streptococcus suis]NQP93620.1 glycosyltransferase family 2 protein [Streptococcus suis]